MSDFEGNVGEVSFDPVHEIEKLNAEIKEAKEAVDLAEKNFKILLEDYNKKIERLTHLNSGATIGSELEWVTETPNAKRSWKGRIVAVEDGNFVVSLIKKGGGDSIRQMYVPVSLVKNGKVDGPIFRDRPKIEKEKSPKAAPAGNEGDSGQSEAQASSEPAPTPVVDDGEPDVGDDLSGIDAAVNAVFPEEAKPFAEAVYKEGV